MSSSTAADSTARLPALPSDVDETFLSDVLAGLRAPRKAIPPKYFYDLEGSKLFDAICELDEYYVTRTELGIMQEHAAAMAASIPGKVRVVEPGAGSSTKARLLIDALGERCVEFVPVDISGEHLQMAAEAIREELPDVTVTPMVGDFTAELPSPASGDGAMTLVYFPGSTVGNFHRHEAQTLLWRLRRLAGRDGMVLLGVDLKKDPTVLHAAYNDAKGVTAAFNKNLLVRINRELDGDFDLDAFVHYAFYDPTAGRIEMHLVSRRAQRVHVAGHAIEMGAGESILTECSYKHDLPGIARLGQGAGLAVRKTWTDPDSAFAVVLFSADATAPGDEPRAHTLRAVTNR
ncbi:MAG: L-histidine N(alpha)-methyltransferase [Myxococcales bacterium]|nr:L-histidine N(alpha)-methyltransferase [Myxococcales bacterium]